MAPVHDPELDAVMTNDDETRYFVRCPCGWKSAKLATVEEAVRAGKQHRLRSKKSEARD